MTDLILNPDSMRYVLRTGAIGKRVIAAQSAVIDDPMGSGSHEVGGVLARLESSMESSGSASSAESGVHEIGDQVDGGESSASSIHSYGRPVPDCISRSLLPLREHQVKVVEFMQHNDSLLVIHGTGLGKTLTAVTTSQCFLDDNPGSGVTVIGPASLLSNFKKEMRAYGIDSEDPRYQFYSFEKFMNLVKAGEVPDCEDRLLIVDEAHNLRNPGSLRAKSVYRCSNVAAKRLLLSATPFMNSIQDFVPLINILYGRQVASTKRSDRDQTPYVIPKNLTESSLADLRSLLRGKVDFENTRSDRHFPEEIIHYVPVPMSREYFARFDPLTRGLESFGMIFTEPWRFLNGYRRAVNKAGTEYFSAKVIRAVPILTEGKSILYSSWIEFGINTVKSALRDTGITYAEYSGATSPTRRDRIVAEFNEGSIQVLIITKAGGEGLDLKGVRNVVVLDPPWNDSSLRQIIGRAIRYKSHRHLPPAERVVNVYLMVLTEPGTTDNWRLDGEDASKSGDRLVYRIIEKKRQDSIQIQNSLQRWSI